MAAWNNLPGSYRFTEKFGSHSHRILHHRHETPALLILSTPVLEKFVSVVPRERSGPLASNRLDFQLSWAFCLMLKLHETEPSYLVALDYHDDVVVFNSEASPTKIEFYQIKTKKPGTWTIESLLERKTTSSLSIIGKMYSHRLNFGEDVTGMHFVSNALYSIIKAGQASSKKSSVEAFAPDGICPKLFQKLSSAIQEEHQLQYCPISDLGLSFSNTPLSVRACFRNGI